MADAPAMTLWTDAYLADTSHLSTFEHGAYLLVLMAMWRAGGSLPNDEIRLSRIAKTSLDKWRRVAPTIMEFFTVDDDGRLTQKRLGKELKSALARVEKARAAGKSGGEAKSLRNKNPHVARATQEVEPPATYQNQNYIEEIAAAISSPAAATISLEEIERRCEEATGWTGLPSIGVVEALVQKGHDLEARILPLLREEAARRRRLGKGPPETWAYFAPMIQDAARKAAAAHTPAAEPLVKIARNSPAWASAAAAYQAEKGKPPPCIDGFGWFSPRMVPGSGDGAAA